MVIVMGESREGCMQKLLPIVRSNDGRFFGFGEALGENDNRVEGRYARARLSSEAATTPDRAAAKTADGELAGTGRTRPPASGTEPARRWHSAAWRSRGVG
jgi:hypothetical protein